MMMSSYRWIMLYGRCRPRKTSADRDSRPTMKRQTTFCKPISNCRMNSMYMITGLTNKLKT